MLKINSTERTSVLLIPLRRSRALNGKVVNQLMMDDNGGIVNKRIDKSRDSKTRSRQREEENSASSGDENQVRTVHSKECDSTSKKTQEPSDNGSKMSSVTPIGTSKRTSY